LTVQDWTDEVAEALERLNVADTLEELRHHIDALIDRLGQAEPAQAPTPDPSAASEGLDRQIDALGRKVESASSMLAQLTDLFESQSERIETIEQQLGDPDVRAHHEGEPVKLREEARATFDELRREIASLRQQREWIEARLQRFEASIERLESTIGAVHEITLRREDRVESLEDRLLIMLEERLSERAAARSTEAATPAAPPARAVVPQLSVPSAAVTPGPIAPGIAPAPASGAAAAPAPVPQSVGAAVPAAAHEPLEPLLADTDTPLDPATARRLEDLVEREIKLQHEFSPGAAAERPGRGGRATVMVVDDSVDARTILSIYLSRTGYQVVTAASAEDCLAKLRHHTIDAIVLDATMPGGGAEHFLRVVHSDPAYRDRARVPVIIYTAHPESMTRDRARQLGASDYLVKGGDLLPLLTTLVRHLNPAGAEASAPEHVSSRF
jgi:CheY-like chemotaxis protein